jgi:nucleoid-associated protein EbfC
MFDGIDFSKLNMNDIVDKFQNIQEDNKEKNEQLIFTAKSGGDMIEISMNGNSQIVDLKIDDSLLTDKDSLTILLITAINDVIKKANDNKQNSAMNIMDQLKPFMQK